VLPSRDGPPARRAGLGIGWNKQSRVQRLGLVLTSIYGPFPGESRRRRDASGAAGRAASQNSVLKPRPNWVRVRTSFGRDQVAQGTGQGPAQRWPARDAARPRMRRDGRPAAAYLPAASCYTTSSDAPPGSASERHRSPDPRVRRTPQGWANAAWTSPGLPRRDAPLPPSPLCSRTRSGVELGRAAKRRGHMPGVPEAPGRAAGVMITAS